MPRTMKRTAHRVILLLSLCNVDPLSFFFFFFLFFFFLFFL